MIADLFEQIEEQLTQLMEQLINHYRGIRCQFKILLDMFEQDSKVRDPEVYVSSPFYTVIHPNFVLDTIFAGASFIINSLNLFNIRGSAWKVIKIVRFEIHIGSYVPITPRGYLKIPEILKHRRGNLLNIKSTDGMCFINCLVASIHREEIEKDLLKNRPTCLSKKPMSVKRWLFYQLQKGETYRKYYNRIDLSGVMIDSEKGVSLEDINTIETNNPVSVNVYTNSGKDIVIQRKTRVHRPYHVDLLQISKGNESHVCLISNLSGLIGRNGIHRHVMCPHCLRQFLSEDTMKSHKRYCQSQEETNESSPLKDGKLSFNNYEMTLKQPYRLYFQFDELVDSTSKRILPYAYSYCLLGTQNEILNSDYYDGPNPVAHFLSTITTLARRVLNRIRNTNNMVAPTPEQVKIHESAKCCALCNREFGNGIIKTFHHDHFSGL
jgi:hypothetical protein